MPAHGPADRPADRPAELAGRVAALVRDVPDFPTAGIVFKDIGPLLADPAALGDVVAVLAEHAHDVGAAAVAGVEARGFILGAPVAVAARLPFVPLRKAGKLPGATLSRDYALEYAAATLQVQATAVPPGTPVLVVDDVLASGGTAVAAAALLAALGAEPVGLAVLLELAFLGGRAACAPLPVEAVLTV